MNNELVEQQLDTTEKRLDDHAERIRKLESVTAVMDNRLAALCTALESTGNNNNYGTDRIFLLCSADRTV